MIDRIEIRGVKCTGTHGVLEFERSNPQEFLIDALLSGDLGLASKTDDVSNTIDYSEVIELIKSVVRGPHSDLLENLAYNIAHKIGILILKSDVLINEVYVKAVKANPPIDDIDTVGCSISLKIKRDVYLSLGSNLYNRLDYLRLACEQLPDVVAVSSLYSTMPQGDNTETQGPYLNCVLRLNTDILPYELLNICHKIEADAGRKRFYKNSARTLDIDILTYGSLRSDNPVLTLPHPRINERAFVVEAFLEVIDNRDQLSSMIDLASYEKNCHNVIKLGKLIL